MRILYKAKLSPTISKLLRPKSTSRLASSHSKKEVYSTKAEQHRILKSFHSSPHARWYSGWSSQPCYSLRQLISKVERCPTRELRAHQLA